MPIETITSELTGLKAPAQGVLSVEEVAAKAASAIAIPYEEEPDLADPAGRRRVIERDRRVYYRDDLSGPLPLGQVESHDALYQRVKAEGREHPGQQPTEQDAALLGLPPDAHPNDWQALRRYRESYSYDAVGNIERLKRESLDLGAPGWTRRYAYAPDSNRLLRTSAPGDASAELSAAYEHDDAGNMVRMPHLPEMAWDYADRLQSVKKQVQSGPGPANEVHFAYDGSGQRVRKVYEHNGLVEERIYLGGYEIYRKRSTGAAQLDLERKTLHVMDDQRRIALVETKTVDTSVPGFVATMRRRFQIENHLGSSGMELDSAGLVITYEEYFPFGATSFRAADSAEEISAKRYRYTGKERDEETGLYYHDARYYAAWLGRWTSCDPAGMVDGPHVYQYVRNNSLLLSDPTGKKGYTGRWEEDDSGEDDDSDEYEDDDSDEYENDDSDQDEEDLVTDNDALDENFPYDPETFLKVGSMARYIKHYSEKYGAPEVAVAGAIADEFNLRRWWKDPFQDWFIGNQPERRLRSDEQVGIDSKLFNFMKHDLGPANIQLQTAWNIYQNNRSEFPSDRWGRTEVADYIMTERGTAHVASLFMRDAQKQFASQLKDLSLAMREAVLVTSYKRGLQNYNLSQTLKNKPFTPGEGVRALLQRDKLIEALALGSINCPRR